MQLLNNITDAANQKMTIPLADGTNLILVLVYRPAIQRWTADISHPQLVMNGYNICLGPNIVRQWRNVVPFGIACTSNNGLDPMQIEDFTNGTCQLFILSAAEVLQVETDILAPVPLVNP